MVEEKIKESKKVEPVFQELLVKLQYGRGEKFRIPRGIINFYHLEDGDALRCELVELRDEAQNVKGIGKEILVDVLKELLDDDIHGKIPIAVFELYNMEKYDYALLRIKEVVHRPSPKMF